MDLRDGAVGTEFDEESLLDYSNAVDVDLEDDAVMRFADSSNDAMDSMVRVAGERVDDYWLNY